MDLFRHCTELEYHVSYGVKEMVGGMGERDGGGDGCERQWEGWVGERVGGMGVRDSGRDGGGGG